MDTFALVTIGRILTYLLILLITLVVSWAIIRGAVLSALRKHSDEQRALNHRGGNN